MNPHARFLTDQDYYEWVLRLITTDGMSTREAKRYIDRRMKKQRKGDVPWQRPA